MLFVSLVLEPSTSSFMPLKNILARVGAARTTLFAVVCIFSVLGVTRTFGFTNGPHHPKTPQEYHHKKPKVMSPMEHRNAHEEFIEAARKGDVNALIDLRRGNHIDINYRSHHAHRQSALMTAALYNHPAAIDYLMHAGADPEIREKSGLTPVHAVTMLGHAGSLRALLDHEHVNVNLPHSDGYTPVFRCIIHKESESIEILRILIEHGADLNVVGPGGMTPLLLAVEKKNVAAVEMITRYRDRVNVNHANHVGLTAVHMAAAHSRTERGKTILMQLIMAGGNLDSQMPTQKITAREFLRMHGVSLPGIPGLDPQAGGTGTASARQRTEL